jgi:DNA-binding FadR family transcriptional regulator
MLKPVEKKSLSDAVFEQLRDEIVSGRMEPGSTLPAERALCDMLNVNRGAVREALKKLEQARLISIQHGGGSRVLDFRETGGLDLVASLVMKADGSVDAKVARGVMELRSALGTDIARRCAERDPDRAEALRAIVDEMETGEPGLEQLLEYNMEFWDQMVDGSHNVAYRLAFNSVRDLLGQMSSVFATILAEEITDSETHRKIADAVANSEVDDAEFYTRDLVTRGEVRVGKIADLIEPRGDEP